MSRTTTHHVPERFLRQLWKHQRFSTDNLQTTDGRSIEILSPGNLNLDGGPDFLDASLRIGDTLIRGNIEIHSRDEEWNEHQHNRDPKYNSVILHVVLSADRFGTPPATCSQRSIPILSLEQYLQMPFHSAWGRMIADEQAERKETIKCYAYNDRADTILIKQWIEKLAVERIELKVRRFDERLKELVNRRQIHVNETPSRYDEPPFGIRPEELPPPTIQYSLQDVRSSLLWNQLLYEGVFEALGYSKNQQPFVKLARNATAAVLRNILTSNNLSVDIFQIESLLFGIAGLLPATRSLKDDQSKEYVGLLSRRWKELRAQYHYECLTLSEWQFFRLRPENFPTVRLAGAARIVSSLIQMNIVKPIIRIIKSKDFALDEKGKRLQSMFLVTSDGFWKSHYCFEETSRHPIKTLVGTARAADIVVNVVIPICLLYARVFKDKEVRQGTLAILSHFPPLNENIATRTIGDQLIKNRFSVDSVMLQQGTLQLHKMYCVKGRCAECMIGEKVL